MAQVHSAASGGALRTQDPRSEFRCLISSVTCCRLSEVSPEELEELEQQVDSECNVQGGLGKARMQDTLGYHMLMLPLSLYRVMARLMPL